MPISVTVYSHVKSECMFRGTALCGGRVWGVEAGAGRCLLYGHLAGRVVLVYNDQPLAGDGHEPTPETSLLCHKTGKVY